MRQGKFNSSESNTKPFITTVFFFGFVALRILQAEKKQEEKQNFDWKHYVGIACCFVALSHGSIFFLLLSASHFKPKVFDIRCYLKTYLLLIVLFDTHRQIYLVVLVHCF